MYFKNITVTILIFKSFIILKTPILRHYYNNLDNEIFLILYIKQSYL